MKNRTKTQELVDRLLVLSVLIDRVAYSLSGKMRERFTKLESEIVSIVAASFPRGFTVATTTIRLIGILSQIQSRVAVAFKDVEDEFDTDLDELGIAVAKKHKDDLFAVFGPDVFTHVASDDQVRIWMGALTFQGATLGEWWKKIGNNLGFYVTQQIRMGAMSSEDLSQVVGRVTNPATGVETQAARAGEMMARTGTLAAQNAVIYGTMKINGHQVDALQQISVLDSRTSQICLAYAFKIWKLDGTPIGHDLPFNGGPPRHPNCRSMIVPIALDQTPLNEYDVDQWLDLQTPAVQKAIIGKGKAELFRAGKITVGDLVNQEGRPLNLRDFKARK